MITTNYTILHLCYLDVARSSMLPGDPVWDVGER